MELDRVNRKVDVKFTRQDALDMRKVLRDSDECLWRILGAATRGIFIAETRNRGLEMLFVAALLMLLLGMRRPAATPPKIRQIFFYIELVLYFKQFQAFLRMYVMQSSNIVG